MPTLTYDTYQFIDRIRRRPGMYIFLCPQHLLTLLHGYWMAMDELGAVDTGLPNIREGSPGICNFHDWVTRKLGFGSSTAGWALVTLTVAMGHTQDTVDWHTLMADTGASPKNREDALELCFSLLDEYRALGTRAAPAL